MVESPEGAGGGVVRGGQTTNRAIKDRYMKYNDS